MRMRDSGDVQCKFVERGEVDVGRVELERVTSLVRADWRPGIVLVAVDTRERRRVCVPVGEGAGLGCCVDAGAVELLAVACCCFAPTASAAVCGATSLCQTVCPRPSFDDGCGVAAVGFVCTAVDVAGAAGASPTTPPLLTSTCLPAGGLLFCAADAFGAACFAWAGFTSSPLSSLTACLTSAMRTSLSLSQALTVPWFEGDIRLLARDCCGGLAPAVGTAKCLKKALLFSDPCVVISVLRLVRSKIACEKRKLLSAGEVAAAAVVFVGV